MSKLYIIEMYGCTEAVLIGPFDNDSIRINYVKDNQQEESCYCRLDIDENGIPSLGSFVNSEIETDEEER